MTAAPPSLLRALGPGILFAGAAIGNSHLVQSTRAGAVYGLGLLGVIVLANVIKYPAFRFGPLYAAATGKSLVHGYALLGRSVLAAVALSQFAVHVIIIAATGITTAGIILAVFDFTMDARQLGAAVIVMGALTLAVGGYAILDRLTRLFVAILTVATVVATLAALPQVQWSFGLPSSVALDVRTFAFVVALMGFMPSALDLSILHSLWTVAKARATGVQPSVANAMLDLNIGYVCSAVLAICFMLMGAAVMHSNAVVPAGSAGEFARQVIGLYTESLGAWSATLVGVSALCVMFTTLLAVLDGMPRLQANAISTLLDPTRDKEELGERSGLFFSMMAVQGAGAILILLYLMKSFTSFIDLVTITSFVVGPFLALLNHLAVTRDPVPEALRPGPGMRAFSLLGIAIMALISIAYFVSLLMA